MSATPAAPSISSTLNSPQPPTSHESFPWLWLLAGGVVLALGAGAVWFRLREKPFVRSTPAPVIERPRIEPSTSAPAEPNLSAAVPTPAPKLPTNESLELALEPLKLSLTLMNATLSYRLEIANPSLAPLENLGIEADMISAHASLPREQQLAGPGLQAPTRHRIDRLEPGESRIVEGEFRLPFPQIVPIRQGNAALLLPLARFRAQAQGAKAVVRTFAVGQPGASGMQPFRLDQGPRVYPQLVQRAFA